MNKSSLALALAVGASLSGCVSLTPGGAKVKVYETDRPAADSAARLPEGCRLVASKGPIDQQAQERLVDDPYRLQRNATAEKGGNVLLLRSTVKKSLPKTECPPGDRSVDCQQTLSTWYRVEFESYACEETAVRELDSAGAQISPGKIAWWWPFGSKKDAAPGAPASASAPAPAISPEPAASAPTSADGSVTNADLKARILGMMRENVGADVLVAYVRTLRVAAPLSAGEIVEWKKAGIPDAVLEAAISQSTR